ncbi:MAG: ATP-grasp domain-containing protein [Archaeoglobaceae archaeon]|nr:ATP-grasp domain-containing protein [Archaeoglobaceae archaeon]MCX8152018.1 ATP-grasp domain-containing protein [Archaeoglobaceae archaeon]MDW8013407.1 ATP-grasp domain-containing protein [Archaeoglobaceae archaeon]
MERRNNRSIKVFLYEHGTCGTEIPESIAVEGLAMFKSLYFGLRKFCKVLCFVRNRFSFLNLPVADISCFESFVESCDAFLIVAPENDYTLLNLTKKAEKYKKINLGSSSKALEITSDKWRLYKRLKRKVNVPRTSKKILDVEYLVKPRVSCGGSGIKLYGEIKDGYIAQEFIKGLNLSVSLAVCDEIFPLSVNEQVLVNFEYFGGVVPALVNEVVRSEVLEEALKAVEAVKGLHGYVGVDLVYSDQPYVVEINARPTTSAVAFEEVYGVSVGEIVYRNEFDLLEPLLPKKVCMLRKDCSGKIIAKIDSNCISLSEL